MFIPLNPTKELILKIRTVLEAAQKVPDPTLQTLLKDPEIREWLSNFSTVKMGGYGTPKRRIPEAYDG